MDIWNIYEEKYLILFFLRHANNTPIRILYVCVYIYYSRSFFRTRYIYIQCHCHLIYTVHFKKSFHMKSIKKLKE